MYFAQKFYLLTLHFWERDLVTLLQQTIWKEERAFREMPITEQWGKEMNTFEQETGWK